MLINNTKEFDLAVKAFTPYTKAFVFADGELCCETCAKKERRYIVDAFQDRDQWLVVGVDVLHENNGETCAHCHEPLIADEEPHEDD